MIKLLNKTYFWIFIIALFLVIKIGFNGYRGFDVATFFFGLCMLYTPIELLIYRTYKKIRNKNIDFSDDENILGISLGVAFTHIILMSIALKIAHIIDIKIAIALWTLGYMYFVIITFSTIKLFIKIKEKCFDKDSFLTLFFKAQAIEFAEKRKEYEQKVQEYNKTSEEKIKAKKAEYAKKIEEANK